MTNTAKYNKEYHRKRYDSDPAYRAKKLKNAIKWTKKNPKKRAEIAKRRNKREKLIYPEKVKCRALINLRVRFGRMPKASSLKCAHCQRKAAHYHHKNGYAFKNRYDVDPVCTKCHKRLDSSGLHVHTVRAAKVTAPN